MSDNDELLALEQAAATCAMHRLALRDALEDLLPKHDRRLLDQFAYRYTRLQDDMGARLFPAILRALGEDVARMPVIDRLNRLEQLGWLPSGEEWNKLRQIRNEFAHNYPETTAEHLESLIVAINSAKRLLEILELVGTNSKKYFPNLKI